MTHRRFVAPILLAACLAGRLAQADEPASMQDVLFARDIQPLLAKHCLLCHGPDEAEAGLRLDLADYAYTETDSGEHAIVPNKPDASELLNRVSTSDESLRMPPDGEPLTADEVDLLRQWISAGAKYEVHWAYQPVPAPSPPEVDGSSWVRNSIDRYVLANLESKNIAPSSEADKSTLIKRLHYDLVGLPPTIEEVDRFEKDNDGDAYEQLVDRLLASKHFGERWGRHWLDKARYADSDGYEKDNSRPNAWRYRDWVIDAVNHDLPFDAFTIEQLAGDQLPDASPTQQLATAFHRQTLTNTEGGTDKEEFRVEATFDRTETTAAVWMALTMTCARCHSHKYDQITQQEYYQLFAFFNNADEANSEVARSEEALAQYREDKEAYDLKAAALADKYDATLSLLQAEIDQWTRDMEDTLQNSGKGGSTPEFVVADLLEAKANSKAELKQQQDHSILASGPVAEKDQYTLVMAAPLAPLTGFRLEVLTHESLGKSGPGRTAHGNFVLSEIRAYIGDERDFKKHSRIKLVAAETDFAQDGFAAEGALSSKDRSGWAISPQMSKDHQITFYTAKPLKLESGQFVQVVLDQQYGGKHTIGRFRVSTMSGFDPLRALPKPVADAIRTDSVKRTDAQLRLIAEHVASSHPTTAKISNQLAELTRKAPKSPMMTVRVMKPAQRTTRVLHRGDFLQPADEVSSQLLATLTYTHPFRSRHPDQGPDRLDLAQWLTSENHPLTSRVTVNHVWAHLFGQGIVPSLNDFGVRGDRPSHPELLDWLAWQFPRDLQWSRKALIKTIVMSATYRQSSHHRPELRSIDPDNRLLARQNRIRVEAEVVRDLQLAVSGLLSQRIGGPSVFPPLPPGVAELSYANNFKWKTSGGEDRYRRGMYTFFKRTSPHPTLTSFDCPDSNTTRLERDSSNTPLQALATLNNDVFAEAAQAMTRRVLADGGEDDPRRLTMALRLCIARQPKAPEVNRFHKLLDAAREYYRSHPEDATLATQRHTANEVATQENAAWVATIRMILNLDEFIVRD